MRRFRLDMVLISAGFDSRVGDPLVLFSARWMRISPNLPEVLLEVADESAGGRLVSVLEGGYNLRGLASAADAHISALAGRR